MFGIEYFVWNMQYYTTMHLYDKLRSRTITQITDCSKRLFVHSPTRVIVHVRLYTAHTEQPKCSFDNCAFNINSKLPQDTTGMEASSHATLYAVILIIIMSHSISLQAFGTHASLTFY